MKTKYTIDYFIKKFKAIPKNRWCCRVFKNERGQRCALGHCNFLNVDGPSKEAEVLFQLFASNNLMVTEVNDGGHGRYKQKHPKDRILAALNHIKTKINKD